VTLPLVRFLGISAVGLGLFVEAVVEAGVLRQAMLKWTQVDVVRPLLVPIASGVVSAGAGWVVADLGRADLLSGLVGGACSVSLFLAFLAVLRRKLLHETFRFAVRSMRAAGSRSAPTHAR
jgi:hypothetical protein